MADAPAWFTSALEQTPEHSTIDVDGCPIHVRSWGDPDKPPLVFVHGGGAHSGWWDHIAPFFARTHRVLAPDLSGHGDSGIRTEYALSIWAREVLAAAAASGSSARPTIIGHSMGGWVGASAATHYGEQIDSILVIDSPLRERAPEEVRLRNRRRDTAGYPTEEEILARFRAVPKQEVTLPYIGHHIAVQSVRKTDDGWVWKFDPDIFGGQLMDETPDDEEILENAFARIPCRIGYLHCEHGVVPPRMAEQIRSILQLRGPFVDLAEAGHHPMLDQPLPLVATIRTLLEFWSIT
ncbi:alpha/beta hydrolase [Mycolicibacterium conceptionense]|uniref:Alpha/beta hydrolase n=2 Tax=Mycobacteriaceae TaxID=1762 RepID=A0A1A0P6K5_9MYCO|nr:MULTISPECIES: alpha/beta hydrolase [Mycolicibacterium]MCW1823675.1 alpha/beta hydrolase [Mycolicibacterium senegalense]OBB05282.1 alpha/beta hydrolase [Mycolicibacterium conceptionense]OBE94425.1 alpha/beta hydrolase [Mycolicibacterium conceptionense]OBF22494.1 alpha/beta hydrolase [Mycolicibacterium conceptionense]OBF40076.1 alpha/beta hydrolase [Mycolicibacterium conceptionense]